LDNFVNFFCGRLKPKQLFLIDAIGGFISVLFLGLILTSFQKYIGVQKDVLYFLAVWPLLFLIYDLFCFFLVENRISFYLKIIAYLNLTYCFLSLSLLIYHHSQILTLGYLYFIFELIILWILIIIEINIANRHNENQYS